jgi:hypothetical protein
LRLSFFLFFFFLRHAIDALARPARLVTLIV